jgi:hypothetical protein
MSSSKHVFKVVFHHQGQIFEIYARRVAQGDLFGFIEVADYVFGEKAQRIIDPAEDRLRSEFEGVSRSLIPLHAIIRIDEVPKHGTAKISDARGDKVMQFPLPVPKLTPQG